MSWKDTCWFKKPLLCGIGNQPTHPGMSWKGFIYCSELRIRFILRNMNPKSKLDAITASSFDYRRLLNDRTVRCQSVSRVRGFPPPRSRELRSKALRFFGRLYFLHSEIGNRNSWAWTNAGK
jgi:hypothetical protein